MTGYYRPAPRWLTAVWVMAGVALLLPASPAVAADVFTWTDDHGTIHFSDSTSDVPSEHRNTIKKRTVGPTPSLDASPPAAIQPPPVHKTVAPPDPAPELGGAPQRFEVPYQPYEGTARRVIVSAKFNDRTTAPMALDTGAPGSLISPKLAKELGVLDEEHGRLLVNVGGLGGTTLAVRTVITSIQIGGARTDFVPVEVTKSISDAFEGLIGMDFMGNYSMRVDPAKNVVVFEELPHTSDRPGGHDEVWWRNTFKEFAAFHNAWKRVLRDIEKDMDRQSVATSGYTHALLDRRDLAQWQTQEAEKLMDRLHRFAREHAVPMHWRTY